MAVCKGIVRDSVVVLAPGTRLPEGREVEVRLLDHPVAGGDAFARVLAGRIPRRIGMDEIVEEDKAEREEHPGTWLRS